MIQLAQISRITRLFFSTIILAFTGISANAQSTIKEAPIMASINHIGLSVKNLATMENWYINVFAMKEIQKLDIAEYHVKTVLLQAPNGLGVELIEVAGATRKRSYKDALDAAGDLGYGHLALTVKDLNKTYQTMLTSGASSVSAPAPAAQKGASFAYVKDPEGNLIELMQLP